MEEDTTRSGLSNNQAEKHKNENEDDNDEDDYEVSNRLVDDYLAQTNEEYHEFLHDNPPLLNSKEPVDINIQNDDHQTTSSSQSSQAFTDKHSQSTKSNMLIYFADKSALKRALESKSTEFSQIVEPNDRNQIFEKFLHFTNRIQSRQPLAINNLKLSKRVLLVLLIYLTLSIYLLGSCIEPVLLIIFTLVLVKILVRLIEIMFAKWLNLAFIQSQCIKRLLTSLREFELVSLSVERRHLMESRWTQQQPDNPMCHDDDHLNLTFRRQAFLKLRGEFHRLRKLNIDLNNELARLPDLVSSVPDSELADVLQLNDQDQLKLLEAKTDYFSLTCLKSMARVVRLVISENFKLNVTAYVELICCTRDSNSWYDLVKLGFRSIQVYVELSRSIREFSELEDVINLKNTINDFREKYVDEAKRNSDTNKIDSAMQRKLGLYLRNSLLQFHSLAYSSLTVDPLESLKLVKTSLDYCEFYVKQLIAGLEKQPASAHVDVIDPYQVANGVEKSSSSNEAVEFVPLPPVEDEIFEEDLSKTSVKNVKETADFRDNDDDDELSLLSGRDPLANKNLFYELKFALKFKSNEWQQREKLAKKKKQEKCEVDEKSNNVMGLISDHLLENDALKYKSELRRRRRLNQQEPKNTRHEAFVESDSTTLSQKRRKYVYEADDDDDNEEKENSRPAASFFTELVNKGFRLQQQADNEETLVYE